MATTGTGLCAGLVSPYLHQVLALFVTLPCQCLGEHAPPRITYGSTQAPVLHHALDMEVFNHNKIMPLGYRVRCLVDKIFALVFDLFVDPGYSSPCFLSVLAAFLFATQASLGSTQSLDRFLQVSFIGDDFPVTGDKERLQPQVQSHYSICIHVGDFVGYAEFLDQETHVPVPTRATIKCGRPRYTQEFPVLNDLDAGSHLG